MVDGRLTEEDRNKWQDSPQEWVARIELTKNGQRAFTIHGENVKVWDLNDMEYVHNLCVPDEKLTCMATDTDGELLASADASGELILWDVDRREELWFRSLADDTRFSAIVELELHVESNRLFVLTKKDLQVWSLNEGEMTARSTQRSSEVFTAMAGVPAVGFLMTGDEKGALDIWDIKRGLKRVAFEKHESRVNDLAVTRDGCRAVSVSDDRTLKVWDLAAGCLLAGFNGESSFRTCEIAPDRSTIVAAGYPGQLYSFRLEVPFTSVDE